MILEPMAPDEFSVFRENSLSAYCRDLAVALSVPVEAARGVAEAQFCQLLPDGMETKNHFFCVVRNSDGNAIGHLWYALRDHFGRMRLFICDIFLSEDHRGQGHGAEMMKWLESRARELDVNEIALHVFGHNARARALYQRMGYETTNVQMVKTLT